MTSQYNLRDYKHTPNMTFLKIVIYTFKQKQNKEKNLLN